jgi:predicted nuclease with TOPRIM domain
MDIDQAYKNLLSAKPEEDEAEIHPMRQRMMELELEKKLLEKKYLELKGEHQ